MPQETENQMQYSRAISSTVMLNKKEMEEFAEKHPDRILRNIDFNRGIDKKATHNWNK